MRPARQAPDSLNRMNIIVFLTALLAGFYVSSLSWNIWHNIVVDVALMFIATLVVYYIIGFVLRVSGHPIRGT